MKKHNCIEKVRKELIKQDDKIEYIRFQLSTISSVPSYEDEDIKTGQEIHIGYKHKRKDGTIVPKERKTFVTHTYCPFCGVKYK